MSWIKHDLRFSLCTLLQQLRRNLFLMLFASTSGNQKWFLHQNEPTWEEQWEKKNINLVVISYLLMLDKYYILHSVVQYHNESMSKDEIIHFRDRSIELSKKTSLKI